MDRNTTSVQTGKDCAPEKNSMELPAGRRFSSTVKNLCEIRTVYLNTATKSRCFVDFERKCFGNFMHLLD
jgi:hypothetical protein